MKYALVLVVLLLSACKPPEDIQLLRASGSDQALVRLLRSQSEPVEYVIGYSHDPASCDIVEEVARLDAAQPTLEALVSEQPPGASHLIAKGIGPMGLSDGSCARFPLSWPEPTTVFENRLEWFRCPAGQRPGPSSNVCEGERLKVGFRTAQALPHVFNQAGGWKGKRDWRIPSLRELATLRRCTPTNEEPLPHNAPDGTPIGCHTPPPHDPAREIAFPWIDGPIWSSLAEDGPVGMVYALDPRTGDVQRLLDAELDVIFVRGG